MLQERFLPQLLPILLSPTTKSGKILQLTPTAQANLRTRTPGTKTRSSTSQSLSKTTVEWSTREPPSSSSWTLIADQISLLARSLRANELKTNSPSSSFWSEESLLRMLFNPFFATSSPSYMNLPLLSRISDNLWVLSATRRIGNQRRYQWKNYTLMLGEEIL